MRKILQLLSLATFTFISTSIYAGDGTLYQAPRAATAPTIDGVGDEGVWATAEWKDANYVYLGNPVSSSDYSARFKVVWDENKIYILTEVVDDVLSDVHPNPLDSYWEDDTWEILLDEDFSGGNHQTNHNAFAYHVSTTFDVVDTDSDGQPKLFNSHVTAARTANGTTYTWEGAFDIYDDSFNYNGTNTPVTLTQGKSIGLGVAYCDNDGANQRDNFFGSMIINGTDKNVAYKTADVFGEVELVDVASPTFTHIRVTPISNNPTVMTMADDGRVFYAEQLGVVRVVENDVLLSTPVLDITSKVNTCCDAWSERGLIGLTLDPDFETNGYMYIYYTTSDGGTHNRVSRVTISGNVMVPSSEVVLLDLDPLSSATNHNGGALHFAPDGTLLVATGENATPSNAQDLTNTHGKLLRINADGSIPSDNPYATDANDATKLIWAHGLRNPFTFDVSPATGKIYVNDVGQNAWEEINDVTSPGGNYHWPSGEGIENDPGFIDPVYTYNHSGDQNTTGCAITGGVFYDPTVSNYPSKYWGKYFFMDYCNNWINVMDPATETFMEVFQANVTTAPVAIDMQPTTGNLYYLVRGSLDASGGAGLYKITYSGNVIPDIVSQPQSQSIAESQPVTFTVQATGAQPLSYQWYLDGDLIPGAESATYSIANVLPANGGDYTVEVSNDFGSVTSNVATLTVTAFNSRPVVTITSPANGITFHAGETFTFTGEATDAEDGPLGSSSLKWRVDLHHNVHVHDGLPQPGSATFEYTIPTSGHTETDIWYRIYLFAEDSEGLTDTAYVELFPEVVDINLQTQPEGLELTMEGQPITSPGTEPSAVGVYRSIGTTSPQAANGSSWKFIGWKNINAAQLFDYQTADKDTTFIAMFDEVPLTNENISAVHDAYVQYTSWQPNDQTTNYNTNQLIIKNWESDPDRETLLTFDLDDIQGNTGDIVAVNLELVGFLEDANGGISNMTINAYEASTTWDETTVTWNTKPTYGSTILSTVEVTGHATSSYSWDITSLVQQKISGGQNLVSIALRTPTNNFNRMLLNSKEATSNQPKLVIEYASSSCTETEWFADLDNDGFGDPTISVMACNQPDGYVAVAGDPCSPAPTLDAGGNQTICESESLSLVATANGAGWQGEWSGPGITNPGVTTSVTVEDLTPGQYTFTYTLTKSGCTPVSDDVVVEVGASPSISDAGPDETICEGNDATLTGNTPQSGETGTWTGPGTINNPTSPSTTVSGLFAGTHTFTYTIDNGVCPVSTDDMVLTMSVCTGVEKVENTGVSVYPNPFENSFVLKTKGAYQVSVYDITGTLVFAGTYSSPASLGADWAAGIYLVNVTTKTGSEVLKVTKH